MFVSLAIATVLLFHSLSGVLSFSTSPNITAGGFEFLSPTCRAIASVLSQASDVYYPGSPQYFNDTSHWASSSSAFSACSVEPGTAEDVGKILQIVGRTRTPFAVKGGGHTSNPGFSSTGPSGVQIAMFRFNEVVYDAALQTATVGAGLVWDDVYAALEPHGVNVVGGRVSGIGVGGFTLGGGYSWKTNQYGLTVDNVVDYELVLPSGMITTVSESSEPDLFFALKGGFNNFGIVTKFTFKTYPQTQVWGGLITYTSPSLDRVDAATVKFSNEVTDPKASIITTHNFVFGQPIISLLVFYDAPTPPPGIFDDFLAIPCFLKDISTRSFLSLVQSSPSSITGGTRTFFHTVSLLNYSPSLVSAIKNESIYWGEHLAPHLATFISYAIEPFIPTIFSHNTIATAYPPIRSRALLPLNLYFAWLLGTEDDTFYNAIRNSANRIVDLAIAEGQDIAGVPLYGNYALFDTPLQDIYGDNVARLREIKSIIDPNNVMNLAGGFRF